MLLLSCIIIIIIVIIAFNVVTRAKKKKERKIKGKVQNLLFEYKNTYRKKRAKFVFVYFILYLG